MIAVDAVWLLDWNQMVSLDFLGLVSDQVVGQSLHSLSRRSRFGNKRRLSRKGSAAPTSKLGLLSLVM